jgi:hypothetical protein
LAAPPRYRVNRGGGYGTSGPVIPHAADPCLRRVRPDAIGFRDPTCATRVALKSLAPHILELGNEIGMLDGLIDVLFSEIRLRSEVRAGLTDQ